VATAIVRVDVNANLQWAVLQAKGGNWVAVCDPLGLTVQGETWAELMEDIGHTLDALLRDLLSTNELNRFLHDHGWKLLAAIPNRPEDVRFDVPFIPAMMAPNGQARELR
jgi:predicted RNase H-like HicB family nuclease